MAAIIVATLVALGLVSNRVHTPVPQWLYWLALVAAAAPGIVVGFRFALTSTFPMIGAIRSMRPAVGAWFVVGLIAIVIDSAHGIDRTDIASAQMAHSFGTLLGAALALVGMCWGSWAARTARAEFERAVAAGEARRPDIGPLLQIRDPGAGAVSIRTGRND